MCLGTSFIYSGSEATMRIVVKQELMRSVAKQDILAVRQAVVCNLVGARSVAHGVRICRKAGGGPDDADARASVELVADGLLVVDDAHQLRHRGCALAGG